MSKYFWIIIIGILILKSDILCQDSSEIDILKYKFAFEYIQNKLNTFNVFNDLVDNLCISLSDEIVFLSPEDFKDEIIKYEYSYIDSVFKGNNHLNEIKDTTYYALCHRINSNYNYDYNSYKNLSLGKIDKAGNCGLILFFGKIIEGRLLAELDIRYENYTEFKYSDWGSASVKYLFYFNNNKICKVFHKIELR